MENVAAKGAAETERNLADRISRVGFTAAFYQMSFRNWLLIAAVRGCAGAIFGAALCFAAPAQPANDSPSGQSRAEKAQARPPTDGQPLNLEAIQRAIERAAGAIEAQKDDAEAQRKERREIRDLDAQEAQAQWAFWMFWPTCATVILTFAGLVLIARTLHYSKEAASAARAMVNEGERATLAALEAAKEAKRQTELTEKAYATLQRPYVFILEVDALLQDVNGGWYVTYTVANYGSLPAIVDTVHVGFVCSETGEPPLPLTFGDDHTLATAPILQAGERRTTIEEYLPDGYDTGGITLSVSGEIIEVSGPALSLEKTEDMFLRIVISYRGPFSQGHETAALWLHERGGRRLMRRGGEEYNYYR